MKYAKRLYRYRITNSTIPNMPVGMNIIDRKHTLIAEWTLINFETGTSTYATGERVDRACSECAFLSFGGQYGHDGEHGKGSAPELPILSEDGAE